MLLCLWSVGQWNVQMELHGALQLQEKLHEWVAAAIVDVFMLQ
jgi:hypothetical protein